MLYKSRSPELIRFLWRLHHMLQICACTHARVHTHTDRKKERESFHNKQLLDKFTTIMVGYIHNVMIINLVSSYCPIIHNPLWSPVTSQQRHCSLTALTSSSYCTELSQKVTDSLTCWLSNRQHQLTPLLCTELTNFPSALQWKGLGSCGNLTDTVAGMPHFRNFLEVSGWPWTLHQLSGFPNNPDITRGAYRAGDMTPPTTCSAIMTI